MKGILQKLLARNGIESFDKLDEEEKSTYRNWDRILSKEELTIDDLKFFLKTQVGIIEAKWKDYGTAREKKEELLPYYTVYKALLDAIGAPQQEREALEAYLVRQLDQ